jgi:hypothetical protein
LFVLASKFLDTFSEYMPILKLTNEHSGCSIRCLDAAKGKPAIRHGPKVVHASPIFITYLSLISLMLFFNLLPGLSNSPFLRGFLTKILYAIIVFHILALRQTHL